MKAGSGSSSSISTGTVKDKQVNKLKNSNIGHFGMCRVFRNSGSGSGSGGNGNGNGNGNGGSKSEAAKQNRMISGMDMDHTGQFMVTTAQDCTLKVYDCLAGK